MNDQRMKSEKRSGVRVITAFLLMLALAVLGLTVSVAADAQSTLTVTTSNLSFENSGLEYAGESYTKVYDGKTAVTISIDNLTGVGIQSGDDVSIEVASASFNDANVANAYEIIVKFKLTGADAYKYAQPADLRLSAKILPKALEWNGNASATVTYDPDVESFEITPTMLGSTVPALKPVTGLESEINALNPTVTFVNALAAANASATPYDTTASVDLGNANFTVASLPVKVTVNPIEITNIVWEGNTTLTYGDLIGITATATVGNRSFDVLKITCDNADFAKGNAGTYTLVAELTDTVNYKLLAGTNAPKKDCPVTILPRKYTVSMDSITVIGDGKTSFRLTVAGDLPESVLSLIEYKLADGTAFNGISAFGSATVVATLPTGNYSFDTADATDVKTLTATITVHRQEKLIPVVNEKGETVGSIILVNREGFADDISATAVAIEAYPSITKATRKAQAYKIALVGVADGEKFSLILPLETELFDEHADKLTLEHLLVYESATKTLLPATQAGKGYSVVLGEGYYILDGFTNGGEITFVIAPEYNTPFFETAFGIVLLILLVLALLVLMAYIGLCLHRILETRENPVLVIDTEGVLPAAEPVELEEKEPVDPDAAIEKTLDEMAEELEVDAAEDETVADETEVQEAVDESMQDLLDEAAQIEDEECTVPEELAESIAEELAETVEAEGDAPADEEAVDAAVAEAMDEALAPNDSADAEDAVEIEEVVEEEAVVEPVATEESDEDDDDDNDDDNDDDDNDDDDAVETMADADSFSFSVGADPSTFINVKEYPEIYAEYLEREAKGEIRIVHRYKKSFTAKLAQSQGNVQDYYSEIKNALLAYKGVKNRISWNYEAFNKGRAHVAKMDAKSKTLYPYLAIAPETLEGTKYGFVDVSAKKKYATTPCLLKIKGERKFKHALELIDMLLGEQMALVKTEAEAVDYRVPRYTIDEMVEQGILKHFAGYIVINPDPTETVEAEAVAADAVVEEAIAIDETVAPETADEAVSEETAEVAPEATEEVAEEAPATETKDLAAVVEELAEVVEKLAEAVEKASVEEAEATEGTVEEVPVEETPIEETPVEETPVEETPVEETPVEKAPENTDTDA